MVAASIRDAVRQTILSTLSSFRTIMEFEIDVCDVLVKENGGVFGTMSDSYRNKTLSHHAPI